MAPGVLIRHTVDVPAPVEDVYAFTQDFGFRAMWDRSIVAATVLETQPVRRVRVTMQGWHEAIFEYRAQKAEAGGASRATSVAMTNIRSWLFASGGGVWTYEDCGAQTRWTQVMRLTLKNGIAPRILRPVVAWAIARQTRRSMSRVVERFADCRA